MQAGRPLKQKSEDAAFLADRFDLPRRKAAALVAGPGEDADQMAADVAKLQQAADPLEGSPTPEEPTFAHGIDMDEVRLKPVLHERNDRSGGA